MRVISADMMQACAKTTGLDNMYEALKNSQVMVDKRQISVTLGNTTFIVHKGKHHWVKLDQAVLRTTVGLQSPLKEMIDNCVKDAKRNRELNVLDGVEKYVGEVPNEPQFLPVRQPDGDARVVAKVGKDKSEKVWITPNKEFLKFCHGLFHMISGKKEHKHNHK